ncbi:MAG: radical SAM protein [Candidatus Omnitrophica bacterium]|nr:radical SAM protein [Candidatus Omnitrophota bacterium]
MRGQSKKILLINPKPGIDWQYCKDDPVVGPPLGLLLVGSSLKYAGYDVRMIDGAIEKEYLATINNELTQKPLWVGLSVMTPQVQSAVLISDLIKKRDKAIPIVWGGVHPTLYSKQTLSDDCVDILVVGQGERAAIEISTSMINKNLLYSVKGIGFKKDRKAYFTENRGFETDLDSLPVLDYDLLKVEKYINRLFTEWNKNKVRTLMVYTGVGCPYKCRFCINSIIYHSHYAFKSAEKILNEIEYLIKKHDVTHIDFRDENFFTNKQRIMDLIEGIEKRKLKFTWEANCRANYFDNTYITDALLQRIEASGCVRIGIGAESGVDRMLQVIRKDITVEDILRSAKMSKKVKIIFGYSFMMGIPGEYNKEMLATAKFILRMKKINKKNYFIGPQIFRPYPGSQLYNECLKYGLPEPDNLRGWKCSYPRSDVIYDRDAAKKIPWINNIGFVRKCHFYSKMSALFTGKGKLPERFIRILISQVAAWRVRYEFFNIPFEFYFYSLLYKIKLSRVLNKET